VKTPPSPEESVKKTAREFLQFCHQQGFECHGLSKVRIFISDRPVALEIGEVPGFFNPKTGTITVFQGHLESLTHELLHWLHHHLNPAGFDSQTWVTEAIPFLAGLMTNPQLPLTPAEIRFLENRLSGSLLAPKPGVEDYGLTGSFVRFIYPRLRDPKQLLRDWIYNTPDTLENRLKTSFGLRNQVAQPFSDFENLFHYFTVALGFSGQLSGPDGILTLGLPSLHALSPKRSRVGTLSATACDTLAPLEFKYFWAPEVETRFSCDTALRAHLLSPRIPPVDACGQVVSSIDPRAKVLIFNPTLLPKTFCVDLKK
jgi:hypothetical protein